MTGHSLGGAMALLFALTVSGNTAHRPIAERMRAVYTFGQPMALAMPLPQATAELERKLFRHVLVQDPIPALPAAPWGPFVHVGQELRYVNGRWERAAFPVEQLPTMRAIPRSLLSFFATEERRAEYRYALGEHGPHQYVSALRPSDRVSEFGD